MSLGSLAKVNTYRFPKACLPTFLPTALTHPRHCSRLPLGSPTSSQVTTRRLTLNYECAALSYACPASSYDLICFFSSTFCLGIFFNLSSFCMSYSVSDWLSGPRHLPNLLPLLFTFLFLDSSSYLFCPPAPPIPRLVIGHSSFY